MNVLIVHAHPEPQSFCSALKGVAALELERQGHQVQVSDLYAMQFNPVASVQDFGERANPDYCVYALEQRHGVTHQTIAPDIRQELDKLQWCDLLILNFPIFWFSTPAILKGWIDRVFVSGTVYGGKRFYNHGGLKGKKAWVCVTLGGQEHMFTPDGIHGPLDDMLRHLLRGTLAYSGMQVLEPFKAWHVPYIPASDRVAILDTFQQQLRNLAQAPALQFPRLEDYDDRLHPLRKTALLD